MNSLPLDTWIRLIDWMAIGLVIYFGYSYTHSRLTVEETEADELPAGYKPPMAALVGILLVLAITIWQVTAPSSMLGLGLQPEERAADNMAVNLGIRLFAWILTGVLVYVLMYGRTAKTPERNDRTRSIGLIASGVNLIVWAGITAWYFMHFHGK